jgi:HlyD family secretion protein
MSEPDRMFRQAALDKLASPEQLDQLMQVTTPKGWLALSAVLVLLGTALVWSVFGSVATQVSGRGILIRPGGVFVISAHGDGMVKEILVQARAQVTNGQVVAEILQPELEIKLRQAELACLRLEDELAKLKRQQEREREAEADGLQKQRAAYTRIIADYTQEIGALNSRVEAEEKLKEAGIETDVQLLDARVASFNAEHDLALVRVQLEQLRVAELQSEQRRQQEWLTKQAQYQETTNQVEWTRALYELNTRVDSPYAGEVLEVVAKKGQRIAANAPVLSLQATSGLLQARLYLSAADGKRVRKDMGVQISPVSVKKEEYGLLVGKVTDVSPFPATPQAMLSQLENPALVNEFSQGGAPMEVEVALELAPNTRTGFRWTSAHGPSGPLTSGTLCGGTITLTQRRPISLVLPVWGQEVPP